jgi:hypothetical protein
MQMGPSLHPKHADVRRMVSEDSDRVFRDRSFLLIIRTGCVVTACAVQLGFRLRRLLGVCASRHAAVVPDARRFQQIVGLTKAAIHLRTVIVTAAVHRGFSSSLAALPLTFRHWAGVSPYT